MKRYCAVVAYEGAGYCGWQSQTRGDSVQEQIESALKQITGAKINIVAAGRTDAGVNARGQIFHFDTEMEMPCRKWMGALNGHLPMDIRIRRIEDAGPHFHARYCVRAKRYDYCIHLGEYDVFSRNYAYQCPYPIDAQKMEEASRCLIGTHDFSSFSANSWQETPNQVRTIYSITFSRRDDFLTISYYGRGFLRYMVRMMTAALLEVGRGRMEPQDVRMMLEARSKTIARRNAHPEGLTLVQVDTFEVCAATDRLMVREYLPEDPLPFDWQLADLERRARDKTLPRAYALSDRHSSTLFGWLILHGEPLQGELAVREGTDPAQVQELLGQLRETFPQLQASGLSAIPLSSAGNRLAEADFY